MSSLPSRNENLAMALEKWTKSSIKLYIKNLLFLISWISLKSFCKGLLVNWFTSPDRTNKPFRSVRIIIRRQSFLKNYHFLLHDTYTIRVYDTRAYQAVRNGIFWEDFAYLQNVWSQKFQKFQKFLRKLSYRVFFSKVVDLDPFYELQL